MAPTPQSASGLDLMFMSAFLGSADAATPSPTDPRFCASECQRSLEQRRILPFLFTRDESGKVVPKYFLVPIADRVTELCETEGGAYFPVIHEVTLSTGALTPTVLAQLRQTQSAKDASKGLFWWAVVKASNEAEAMTHPLAGLWVGIGAHTGHVILKLSQFAGFTPSNVSGVGRQAAATIAKAFANSGAAELP